jgi:CheY-like chemotaxis protein
MNVDAELIAAARHRRLGSAPPPNSLKVFVADDDECMRTALAEGGLRAGGHCVVEACDGAELLMLVHATLEAPLLRPHVIVADVRMPNLSGLDVLAALQQGSWNVPVVLISALADESLETLADRMGAIAVIRKPFDLDDLLTALFNADTVLQRAQSALRRYSPEAMAEKYHESNADRRALELMRAARH